MATTSHTIYSFYDPEDREQLERETGQLPADPEDTAKVWQEESSMTFKRRLPPPPRFVPATIQDGEWNVYQPPQPTQQQAPTNQIAGWYKSLNRASTTSTPSTSGSSTPASVPPRPSRETADNNLWFIRNAIRSEPTSSSSSTSTLADILAREPPPLPSEPQFKPPVFLAIGPCNKGFNMLEKSGWNEGEALGPDIIRRKRMQTHIRPNRKGKRRAVGSEVKEELVEVPTGDDEVQEVRKVSVVDLTLSDSESGSQSDSNGDSESSGLDEPEQDATEQAISPPSSSSDRKALITPLPTVLKSDRLGIGLKAKTVGPYKESRKRVVHGAAALAAHIKANEDMQKRKRRFGRGQRGFARESKQEQLSRQALLAYMNE